MNRSVFPIIGEESKLPFYVTAVGGLANQHHIVRPNGYHQYQFIYCTKGSGILTLEDKEYNFSQGTGFILYPGIVHEYYAVVEPWETHWIAFEGSAFPDLLVTLGFDKSDFFYVHDIPKLDSFLDKIYVNSQSESISRGYKASSLLYNFLIELKSSISHEKPQLSNIKYDQLQKVINYIEANFTKAPSLDDISSVIDVSPQYLCRLFNNLLNMRPFEYITKRRIQEAKRLLLEDTLSVKDIASEIGYNDSSYFCAVFRRHESISPQEFRSMHKSAGSGN